jgi:hypothetical protein
MIDENKFRIDVSFLQLAIFGSSLEQPFNSWSDAQFAQGFSWRPDSISFRTLEDGPHTVTVLFSRELPIPSVAAVRAITVPLELSDDEIEISSISDSVRMRALPGRYQILCEFRGHDETHSRIVFITLANSSKEKFAILVADKQLHIGDSLVKHCPQ